MTIIEKFSKFLGFVHLKFVKCKYTFGIYLNVKLISRTKCSVYNMYNLYFFIFLFYRL